MAKVYTLFCQESDGHWYPQFSDSVRKVVKQEELDSYRRMYAANRCATFYMENDQDSQDYVMRMLNKHGRNIRL